MMKMENEMNVNVPLEIIKASEIEPKEVKWLWYPYIPYGKVTLLQQFMKFLIHANQFGTIRLLHPCQIIL